MSFTAGTVAVVQPEIRGGGGVEQCVRSRIYDGASEVIEKVKDDLERCEGESVSRMVAMEEKGRKEK